KARVSYDTVVRSRRIITPGGMVDGGIAIEGEKIAAILPRAKVPKDALALDDLVVMPGLVDTHVHVNEPGRTEWEGFVTATRAAAAGGITTLCDMPLNCIPVTTTRAALATKLDAIQNLLSIDCGFWGGVVPGNVDELEPMIEAGVLGFKAFLVHSG